MSGKSTKNGASKAGEATAVLAAIDEPIGFAGFW